MKNITIITDMDSLVKYRDHAVKQAQIELINDHIRPFSATKARKLIKQLNAEQEVVVSRKKRSPQELTVKVVRGSVSEEEVQFLVR